MDGGVVRILGLLTGLGLSSTAWAACASPYTIDALLVDLTGLESSLRDGDDAQATASGNSLKEGLSCLDEVLPAPIAGRAYRAVGAGLYAAGDSESANRWFRTSLELEPTWVYGLQDIPEGHPLRNDFDNLKATIGGDQELLAGKEFGEGQHYLDGRKLSTPKARQNRLHLFQVENNGLSTVLIEGNAFPPEFLTDAAVAAVDESKKKKDKVKEPKQPKEPKEGKVAKVKEPKEPKEPKVKTTVGTDGTVYYKRVRPPEKTPLMIAGGAIIVGAAGIYYGSTLSARKFKGVQTAADVNPGIDLSDPSLDLRSQKDPVEEVERLAGVTNRLVVASAAVFAVGVGTLTWGVILDGGNPMPAVNVRW